MSTKLPGDQTAGKAIGEIVALLVQLVTLRQPTGHDNTIDGVVKAARATMSLSLGVMPAAEFVNVILSLLETGDTRACHLFTSGRLSLNRITDSNWCTGRVNESSRNDKRGCAKERISCCCQHH